MPSVGAGGAFVLCPRCPAGLAACCTARPRACSDCWPWLVVCACGLLCLWLVVVFSGFVCVWWCLVLFGLCLFDGFVCFCFPRMRRDRLGEGEARAGVVHALQQQQHSQPCCLWSSSASPTARGYGTGRKLVVC